MGSESKLHVFSDESLKWGADGQLRIGVRDEEPGRANTIAETATAPMSPAVPLLSKTPLFWIWRPLTVTYKTCPAKRPDLPYTLYCSLIAAVACQYAEVRVSKTGRSPGDHGATRSMIMLKSSDER